MIESVSSSPVIEKSPRPVGVWILTIYALTFAGIFPLLLAVFMLFSGNAAGNEFSILLSLTLSVGVVTSAIGAWKGNNKARKFLLIFVTLHYVLVGLNNYLVINSGQIPDAEQTRLWGRVFRGFLYPAVYIWYFNKYTTKEFYK